MDIKDLQLASLRIENGILKEDIKDIKPKQMLDARDLANRFGVVIETLHRWTNEGRLPKPEYLNGRRVWHESDIEDAEARILTRNNPNSKPPQKGGNIRKRAKMLNLKASYKSDLGWAFFDVAADVWITDPDERLDDAAALTFLKGEQ